MSYFQDIDSIMQQIKGDRLSHRETKMGLKGLIQCRKYLIKKGKIVNK